MQFVMGIDPSLVGTAEVVLNESGILMVNNRIESVPCGDLVEDRFRRYSGVVRQLVATAADYQPKVICIEGYSLGSIGQGVSDRIELGALIRAAFIRRTVVIEVPPTCLKKWVTGKGAWKGGGKTPLIVAICKRYGVEFGSDDEYDAYGLAQMARHVAGFAEPSANYQIESVAASVRGRPPKKGKKKPVLKE